MNLTIDDAVTNRIVSVALHQIDVDRQELKNMELPTKDSDLGNLRLSYQMRSNFVVLS